MLGIFSCFFNGSVEVEEIRPWSKAQSVFASWADPTEDGKPGRGSYSRGVMYVVYIIYIYILYIYLYIIAIVLYPYIIIL